MAHWDSSLPVTSSEEPVFSPNAEECYRDALRALLDSGVPFVVGGAFAIHRHTGIWRTTKDLDFFLEARSIPAAFRCLEKAGFTTEIEDPVWLAKARRGDVFVDLITGVGSASLPVHASWITSGIPEQVLGIDCTVLGPEECIASKCFVAFRERFDGADVAHLIKACGRDLDWPRLLAMMNGYWELLYWSLVLFAYVYPARVDVVPPEIWTELAAQFARRVQHPDRNAPFRGTLVDPRMFAIDVEEWGERDLYREYCENHPCLIRQEDSMESDE